MYIYKTGYSIQNIIKIHEHATIRPFSQLIFKCVHLRMYFQHLKIYFPRHGEQCPVDGFSYKGYSPPKCTCNDMHTHSSKIMHIPTPMSTCHVPYLESSPTPSHMHSACMKKCFQNKYFCFQKFIGQPSISKFIGQPSDII